MADLAGTCLKADIELLQAFMPKPDFKTSNYKLRNVYNCRSSYVTIQGKMQNVRIALSTGSNVSATLTLNYTGLYYLRTAVRSLAFI